MLLGVHVSIAGHIYEAVTRAVDLGCTAMQIFPRDPRQWRKTKLSAADIDEFVRRRRAAKIGCVAVHLPYLINLASPDGRLYHGSIRACVEDIKEAEALGADCVVVHTGSHKKKGENFGLSRVTRALNRIMDKTPGCETKILLENTAGSGSWLGYKFSHQRKIIAKVNRPDRVGVCLDTCHAYAAGFNISRKEGYDRLMEQIGREVGFEKVGLIHFNDCASEAGSHYDIHADIGKGNIGAAGLRLFLKDPRLNKKAFILETPKESAADDRRNLAAVKKIRGTVK